MFPCSETPTEVPIVYLTFTSLLCQSLLTNNKQTNDSISIYFSFLSVILACYHLFAEPSGHVCQYIVLSSTARHPPSISQCTSLCGPCIISKTYHVSSHHHKSTQPKCIAATSFLGVVSVCLAAVSSCGWRLFNTSVPFHASVSMQYFRTMALYVISLPQKLQFSFKLGM